MTEDGEAAGCGSPAVRGKFSFYESFWRGEGPCAILFAEPHLARGRAFRKHDLVEQHHDLDKHLEERLLEVEPHLELVDDGIPALRSDLGTTLLPSALGLKIELGPELHPWLAEHLSPQQYLEGPPPAAPQELLRGELAFSRSFYQLFLRRREQAELPAVVFPYLPDTQGVFDLSHQVIGTPLFYLLVDQADLAHKIQSRSLELFLAATRLFKQLLGEKNTSMVHGHGMPCGVWFPDSGARISEDSATLISEPMIREYCLPYIEKAARSFGRLFLHFCGHHPGLLRLVCRSPAVSTVNLGNPEMYDLDEVFSLCARSGTVYFGHLPRLEEEDGESYLERLAEVCRRHGTRLILVAAFLPADREEKAALVRRWHRLTG